MYHVVSELRSNAAPARASGAPVGVGLGPEAPQPDRVPGVPRAGQQDRHVPPELGAEAEKLADLAKRRVKMLVRLGTWKPHADHMDTTAYGDHARMKAVQITMDTWRNQ
ncbi:hypothetical protein EYF80_056932 [Liparis tanakae]|uniref:Uncharacterized protein n=1 Tax=Liparis tanakae TaxID=230148 RepID=A0A4Z2EVL3_9TELE|nr:hypothetical protein EYF80_056932 [Liparis tanakae]